MTLEEIKTQVLSLIEEYDSETAQKLTKDSDIDIKLNHSIDNIQVELAQIKSIPALKEVDTEKDGHEISIDNVYKIDKIRECDFEVLNNKIILDNDYTGKVNIYYNKFPEKINYNTENSHVMELTRDALECLVYGVASAILKADLASNYSVYEYKYQELKQMLSDAKTTGEIRFVEEL